MENIATLKAEAYKIATHQMHPGYPEFGYVHDTNTRLRAMEVYARLVSVEMNKKENNDE